MSILSIEVEENLNCIVCYANCRNIIFRECKHLAICKDCQKREALKLDKCPLCRQDLEGEAIEVYDCERENIIGERREEEDMI